MPRHRSLTLRKLVAAIDPELMERFESVRAKAEQLKQLQAETEAELEDFMPSLLAKAFRGEL